jgi:hypothetical protein
VWRWGDLRWHNVGTKFCENQASGSEVESGDTHMFGQHGDVIRFQKLKYAVSRVACDRALMPLVFFAVANASLPPFFADDECLSQEDYECERATCVFGCTNDGGICQGTLCFGLSNEGE